MWTLELKANNFIEIKNTIGDERYILVPAGEIMLLNKIEEPINQTIIVHGLMNNISYHMKTSEILSPAIGSNSFETYMEKLGQYLNGDNTIVF
jgi:hypothetical protein